MVWDLIAIWKNERTKSEMETKKYTWMDEIVELV